MSPGSLLLCTDLDRTLLPNGAEPESPGARVHFARLAAHPQISLGYVSGRHRELVEEAIAEYALPLPDYVIGDVGTTLYRVGAARSWERLRAMEAEFGADWCGLDHDAIHALLGAAGPLRLQEHAKQNDHKLSYYVPRDARQALEPLLRERLAARGVRANLVWSEDTQAGTGLLDVLPASASKYHAVRALMDSLGHTPQTTLFCGDSGNDLDVLESAIPAVLVANAGAPLREQAMARARALGNAHLLYAARGGFHGMNGNYSAGILEGVAHFHPWAVSCMGLD